MAYVHATQERHVDLEIYQGATFVLKLQWLDEDDNPVDLTGASVSMQIRESVDASTKLYTVSQFSITEAEGKVEITIPDTDTEQFDWEYGVYDLLVTRPSGRVDPITRGAVGVKKAITRS